MNPVSTSSDHKSGPVHDSAISVGEQGVTSLSPLPENPPLAVWARRLTSPGAAAIVLALFWVFMLASVSEKSLTSDEIAHATAGYTYWKYGDYRLNPENGNLPQRVMALPLVLSDVRPPPRDSEQWHHSDEWGVGDFWFHQMGHDVSSMLQRGRAAIGVLTAALGALVWWWARRLFGPAGGMVSLLVFVLSPTVLANGALMTSDATCSLFFLASVTSVWAVLHRVTLPRLVASGLIVGGLFASKMSAVLMLPIGLTLVIARVLSSRPLWVGFGFNRELTRRGAQTIAFAGVFATHVLLVALVIWGCYGFRYASFAPPVSAQDRFQHPWEYVLGKPDPLSLLGALKLTPEQQARANEVLAPFDWRHDGAAAVEAVRRAVLTPSQAEQLRRALDSAPPTLTGKAFAFLRRHRLLPEGYIYGYAHAWQFSRLRSAFFNGEYGVSGWKTFFPYTFAVKTPLPAFGLMLLAFAAAVAQWRSKAVARGESMGSQMRLGLYATLPLWALLVFYWAAVIPSRLNIGHRHIMATYPPLFVLCGAAGYWLQAWWSRAKAPGLAAQTSRAAHGWAAAVCGLAALLAAEVAYRYPHYLAYFNGIVTPAKAYRHLVDSSLDWGQDLPGLKRYLETTAPAGPVYLSYFGTASPRYYGISATYLYSAAGWDLPRTPVRELQTTSRELDAELAAAKRDWADCEVIARGERAGGGISVFFLQRPALPPLRGGTYCISATMLPAIFFGLDGPLGEWNERFETKYRELQRTIQPLLVDDAKRRSEAFIELPAERWSEIFESFAQYRFARLTAYLRQREPNHQIGYSILIYQLSDADVERALEGPAPELGEDLPTALAKRGDV